MKVTRSCLVCSKEFKTTEYLIGIGKGKYCGKTCSVAAMVGRKQSDETRKKRTDKLRGRHWKVKDTSRYGKHLIGRAPWNKGKKMPSGKDHPNFGKHWKIKDTSRFGKHIEGEKNPKWRGGVSKDPIYVSWSKNKRNRVIKRIKIERGTHTFGEWELLKSQYGFRCPSCGENEPKIKLTEDHIIPLSKGGSDRIENVQPLCLSCNCRKHTLSTKY